MGGKNLRIINNEENLNNFFLVFPEDITVPQI